MKRSQARVIVEYLKANPNGITTMEAFSQLGICRLGARIHDIKKEGVLIAETGEWEYFEFDSETVLTTGGARVTRYRIKR